jgi:hypothetical protein
MVGVFVAVLSEDTTLSVRHPADTQHVLNDILGIPRSRPRAQCEWRHNYLTSRLDATARGSSAASPAGRRVTAGTSSCLLSRLRQDNVDRGLVVLDVDRLVDLWCWIVVSPVQLAKKNSE